jgi:phage terminase large subunit-like protein
VTEDLSLEEVLEELQRRLLEGGWASRFFNEENTRELYAKHWEFFDAGATHRFRTFTAGNRVGKSLSAACELVMHLTGDYHPEWKGRRFDEGPVNVWIVGRSSELVRLTIQPLLIGEVSLFGTGLIPKDKLDLDTLTDVKKASTPITQFRVKHKSGGFSTVALKSGEQGREAFQAAALDIVWLDEEIPFDVYGECLIRLMTKNGIAMYTFTPLKGQTDIIKSLKVDGTFKEGDVGGSRYVVRCSMHDAAHLTKEMIADIEKTTPPFLRDARIHGIPALGAGAIYPVPESEFVIKSFPIPPHWKRLYGMDVGAKTAAVWIAQDPETNQWHTYQEYYKERAEPSIHGVGILARGKWIPGAIDPASRGRSQIDGQQLMQMYEDLGLNLTKAVNAVESGLYTVWELLSTDQLKVHDNCTGLLEEIRSYRRDEKGNVVKEADHRCDAWRYAVMTRDISTSENRINTVLDSSPSKRIRM